MLPGGGRRICMYLLCRSCFLGLLDLYCTDRAQPLTTAGEDLDDLDHDLSDLSDLSVGRVKQYVTIEVLSNRPFWCEPAVQRAVWCNARVAHMYHSKAAPFSEA